MMEILSLGEFKEFDGFITQGISNSIKQLEFDDGSKIKATSDHRFLQYDRWVNVSNLILGDRLSDKTIIKIDNIDDEIVYDALNVRDTHSYYTNGVISHNCSLLFIDEGAIIPGNIFSDFWSAVYPTISSGKDTKVIMTSTPLGLNHFWKIWNEAVQGINGFISFTAHWSRHPNRDDAWADEQLKALGEVKFQQECNCSFIGSSNTLVSGSILSTLTPQPFVYSTEDGLDILEKPIKGHVYITACDTSEGRSKDYSTFVTIDITSYPFKIVAKYRNNSISSNLYPNVINRVATEYNYSFVLVEVNKAAEVAYILYEEIGYENLICTKMHEKKGQIPIEGGYGKTRLGVYTDKKVKRIGCNRLKTLIEDQKLLINDKDIITELSTFIEKGNSYEADVGNHDDLVMCLVMFSWLSTFDLFSEITNVNYSRESLYEKQLNEIDSMMLPIGHFDNGIRETNPYAPTTYIY